MTNNNNERIKYFVTNGRGTFDFVKREIDSIGLMIDYVEGKILFESVHRPCVLTEKLKTVERLFLCIYFEKLNDSQVNTSCLNDLLGRASFKGFDKFYEMVANNFDNDDEHLAKKSRQTIKYHINTKITGRLRSKTPYNHEATQKLIEKFQSENQNSSHYEHVTSEQADIDIIVHVSDTCIAFGVQVVRQLLSQRSYIKHIGLRSTICAIILQLADLQPNSIVYDPFCGFSTIFTELLGSCAFKSYFFIGSDLSPEQLSYSSENIKNLPHACQTRVDFLQFNFNGKFSIRDSTVDAIVTDLPFGKKHTRKQIDHDSELLMEFYLNIINEFGRILVSPHGTATLLVNSNEASIFESALNKCDVKLCVEARHCLSLGETNATLYKLMSGEIGQRIFSTDSYGTVRYVGHLADSGSDDIWYGIEWDDGSRGKHNGSFKGKQYFQTKHEIGGSFLKKNKIDFGVDIYRAAKEKYLQDFNVAANKDKKADANQDEIIFNCITRTDQLKAVSLAYCKIRSTDTCMSLTSIFPRMKELDLDANLLTSWAQIFQVLNCFPNLTLLNVSNNKLTLPDVTDTTKFENVEYLIMNRMDYDWDDVLLVLRHFPRVKQLKACFNSITSIKTLNDNLNNLKLLDLESNDLSDWNDVIKLGELESLEELYIQNAGLRSVFFNDCSLNEKTKYFKNLKSLALNQNKLDSWSSVNELNKLTCLAELRLILNPLNNSTSERDLRDLVVAKIESLKILNRTIIGDKFFDEREESEFSYLRGFLKEYVKSKKESRLDDFHREHPRYLKFIEKYGLPELDEVTVKPETVKSNLISLNIENDQTKEVLQRKIPSTMTIQRLKVLITKLFAKSNFENDSIRLICRSTKQENEEYELDNEMRDLGFFSVENDDTISVQLKTQDFYVRFV